MKEMIVPLITCTFCALLGLWCGFWLGYSERRLRRKKKQEPETEQQYPLPPGTKIRASLREDGNAELLVAVRPDGIQYLATKVTDPETGKVYKRHLLLRPGTIIHITRMLEDCIRDLLAEQVKGRQDDNDEEPAGTHDRT